MNSNIIAITRFGLAAIAVLALSVVCGCGGGSSGSTVAPSISGSYQGVFLSTSGKSAPGSGTAQLVVSASGAATVTVCGAPNFASSNSFSGTLAANQLSLNDYNGNRLSGTVSRNVSTGGVTVSFTLGDGTRGVIYVGLVPASTSLAGFAHAVDYAPTQNETIGVGTTGFVGRVIEGPGTVNGPGGVSFQGYIDSSNVLYLAYNDGSYEIAVGKLTLSGTAETGSYLGTVTESPSGNAISISIAAGLSAISAMAPVSGHRGSAK